MNERYKLLHDSTAVKQSIGRMASEITAKYSEEDENPLFVALLRGANPFASRLMFEIARQAPDFNPELDYMTTKRYDDDEQPLDEMEIVMGLSPKTVVKDRKVVVLDDVFDMGGTAEGVYSYLIERGARWIELAVLAEKDVERSVDIKPDYVGFKAPNAWLVGMGMDDSAIAKESYRWRDGIWVVTPEAPTWQPAELVHS